MDTLVRIANYVPPSLKKKKIEKDVEARHICRAEVAGNLERSHLDNREET